MALSKSFTFWWCVHTHTEWVPFGPAVMHHLGLKLANFEKLKERSGFSVLKEEWSSLMLHRSNLFLHMLSLSKAYKIFLSNIHHYNRNLQPIPVVPCSALVSFKIFAFWIVLFETPNSCAAFLTVHNFGASVSICSFCLLFETLSSKEYCTFVYKNKNL